MSIDAPQSVVLLAASHPALRVELSRIRQSWSPEEPPLYVAMGALGKALALAGDSLDDASVDTVTRVIEHILETGSDSARDGVSAGLLEALIHRADEMPGANRILNRLGPSAKAYCDAWNKFTRKDD